MNQATEIAQPNTCPSFLGLGVTCPVIEKLETYRLYKSGVSPTKIAQDFGFSRPYLYQMWKKLENEGASGLINKNWGSAPRKVTPEVEAQILRAKALNPSRGDAELAEEFGLHRSTIYRLLKEHGLQDLHLILEDKPSMHDFSESEQPEMQIVPSSHCLLLTTLPAIQQTGALEALSLLQAQSDFALYSDGKLHLALLLVMIWGLWRLSHIDDLPTSEWGVLLDHSRRPHSDTFFNYCHKLIELDEDNSLLSVAERGGQVVPYGYIEQAQLSSLVRWVEAGLTNGDCWYFDAHIIEYSGKAKLGKTKHGTKAKAVKAVKRFTISNGLCSLDYYAPTFVTYEEGCRYLVTHANHVLPKKYKIRLLAFDREAWNRGLLDWLEGPAQITPVLWVKNTVKIRAQLEAIPSSAFEPIRNLLEKEESDKGKGKPANDSSFLVAPPQPARQNVHQSANQALVSPLQLPSQSQNTGDPTAPTLHIGKESRQELQFVADQQLELSDWGEQRVVLFETDKQKRIAIYTTAARDAERSELTDLTDLTDFDSSHATLSLPVIRTPLELVDDLRFKQRIENQFKVGKHEIGADALPSHRVLLTQIKEPFDGEEANKALNSAQKRVEKYQNQHQELEVLYEEKKLDKHQLNILQRRSLRLEKKAQSEIQTIQQELEQVQEDKDGQAYIESTVSVLDLRMLTLLNLFKHHALVILKLLAQNLGLDTAGPERLRRAFFPFGERVEFNPQNQVATVFAKKFPTKEMRDAYAHFSSSLEDNPPTLTHQGVSYRLQFKSE